MEKYFERASKLKLRFAVEQGMITDEDLWDLPLKALNTMAKKLNKALALADEEDFLEEESKEDALTRLKFNIVLYVLKAQKEALEKRKDAVGRKAEKERLLGLLDDKNNEADKNLSPTQLKKKIKELEE